MRMSRHLVLVSHTSDQWAIRLLVTNKPGRWHPWVAPQVVPHDTCPKHHCQVHVIPALNAKCICVCICVLVSLTQLGCYVLGEGETFGEPVARANE
jgi:hypothetical protein